MDKGDEINEKCDQYAKRMLLRKGEKNQTFESYSRNLRRRMSIMEALNGHNITSPSSCRFDGNPFETEFGGANRTHNPTINRHSTSYIGMGIHRRVTCKLDIALQRPQNPVFNQRPEELNLRESSGKVSMSTNNSLYIRPSSPENKDSNSIKERRRRSSQFRSELLVGIREVENERTESSDSDVTSRQEIVNEPRISLGEYFGGSSNTDPALKTTFSKTSQILDQLFPARVLEVIEPQVIEVIHKDGKISRAAPSRRASDIAIVQEHFKPYQQVLDPELESISTSMVSEDIRDIDREIAKLNLHQEFEEACTAAIMEPPSYPPPPPPKSPLPSPPLTPQPQQSIAETPKRLYPSMSPIRKMSDHFTPVKLFHAHETQGKSNETDDPDFNPSRTKTFDDSKKSLGPKHRTFTTSLTIPISQPNQHDTSQQIEHDKSHKDESSTMSFLRRNSSLLFSNLHLPKLIPRKSNMGSTRKGSPTLSRSNSEISDITPPIPQTNPDINDKHEQQQMIAREQWNKDAPVPYEVENFLELALGDDHYSNSIVTYANCDTKSSHLSASELISEERTPPNNRISNVSRVPMSEPTKPSNSTLNRTLTKYRTLTQRIKKKFQGMGGKDDSRLTQDYVLLTDRSRSLEDTRHSVYSVHSLRKKLDIQEAQIYQLSKALELCSSRKEFASSTKRVESERFLLLANLYKDATLSEIRRLSIQRPDNNNVSSERGEVTIKGLSLQLRDDVPQETDVLEWFVIVMSEGLTVLATHAVPCPHFGQRLYFPENMTISALTPDFRLNVKVYSLKLRDAVEKKANSCLSPTHLLKRSIISPKQYEIRFSGIKESSFNLRGTLDLMLHDLNLPSPWPLINVPQNSILYGTIDMKLTCKLQLTMFYAGFLTHGDEAGGLAAWNRRWCILEGHKLYFWNYPREQESRPPLYEIDLVNCVSEHIGLIDRSLCARPRTLLVETIRGRKSVDKDSIVVECRPSFTVVRNLLSCDTNQDLTEWQSRFNHVVSSLRKWNIIDTKSLPEVSDL